MDSPVESRLRLIEMVGYVSLLVVVFLSSYLLQTMEAVGNRTLCSSDDVTQLLFNIRRH